MVNAIRSILFGFARGVFLGLLLLPLGLSLYTWWQDRDEYRIERTRHGIRIHR